MQALSLLHSMKMSLERKNHATKDDPNGAQWCKSEYVGKFRKDLEALENDENHHDLRRASSAKDVRDTAAFLEWHCSECRLCCLGFKEIRKTA